MRLFDHPAWPHLRAALIAFHVVGMVLAASPAPRGEASRARTYALPSVVDELQGWSARLRDFGVEATPEQLAMTLRSASKQWLGVREAVLRPWFFVQRHTGTRQGWNMFAAPDRYPPTFRLEVDRGAGFEAIYDVDDDTRRWRSSLLHHHRVRRTMNIRSAKWNEPIAFAFCDRLAARAFDDFADARAARCVFEQLASVTPEEMRAGTRPRVRDTHEHVVTRPLPRTP
jgi:hypothetical protein